MKIIYTSVFFYNVIYFSFTFMKQIMDFVNCNYKGENIIFSVFIIAVASLNVKIANNIQDRNNAMSLVNLENITEAQECVSVKVEHMSNGRDLSITTNSCSNAISITEFHNDANGNGIRMTYLCSGNSNETCELTVCGQIFKGTGIRSVY